MRVWEANALFASPMSVNVIELKTLSKSVTNQHGNDAPPRDNGFELNRVTNIRMIEGWKESEVVIVGSILRLVVSS